MIPKSRAQLEEVRRECKAMVTKRALLSGGAAVVPIPGADLAADVGLLLELIPAINRRYGLTDDQIEQLDGQTKAFLYTLIKKAGYDLIGKALTKDLIIQVLKKVSVRLATKEVVKYVPIIGQAAAAGISFAAMKIVGNSHVEDCYRLVSTLLENTSKAAASDMR